jgi:hypothetical protein
MPKRHRKGQNKPKTENWTKRHQKKYIHESKNKHKKVEKKNLK